MKKTLLRFIVSCICLFVFLSVLFLFLGLEMSASYTRSSPDCSVWCVLEYKLLNIINRQLNLKTKSSLENRGNKDASNDHASAGKP